MKPSLLRKPYDDLEVYTIDLSSASDEDLLEISREMGLSMSLERMRYLKQYFKERPPTDVELQMIGQTWSEHCFHNVFKGDVVTDDGRLVNSILKTYIMRSTKELDKDWCISVFEDNAGIIDFDKGYAVAVKVETHNHPSAVEPFGGAATGVGGVMRDILGVWGEPVALTDVLCFGPLDTGYDELPPGVKHPRYLYRGVVAGIGSYGNNMGIPTVSGAVIFDKGYTGNVVVYCGCIGVLPKDAYVRNTHRGDLAVLAGGRTGRDGIHGVTFASAELTEEAEELRSAVQIPNPIVEERLRRAVLRIRDERLATGITDL
ncbi:MAG: AIR synthase related protein, partial [Candidatus Jordarchaeales archaeon]